MYYVYLLVDKLRRIYIGYTSDMRRRLDEHQHGKVYWTRRMIEPKLLYYEAYTIEEVARQRESKLKLRGSAYQGLIKRIGLKQ